MLGVQLADVLTRCSSHPKGKSEARCRNDGNFIGVALCSLFLYNKKNIGTVRVCYPSPDHPI